MLEGHRRVPKGHLSPMILPGVDSSFSQQKVRKERCLVNMDSFRHHLLHTNIINVKGNIKGGSLIDFMHPKSIYWMLSLYKACRFCLCSCATCSGTTSKRTPRPTPLVIHGENHSTVHMGTLPSSIKYGPNPPFTELFMREQ